MLNVMEENHVNRKDIDWASFRNNVLAKAKGVQSIKDAYSAVSLALTDLDDNVSFVKYETYLLVGDFTKSCSNGNGASQPVGHVDGVSYINMYPSFAGDDTPFGSSGSAGDLYATNLQAIIKNNDLTERVGWMIDLRRVHGNNLWAMLAGLGPILGNGVAGYFIDPDGNELTYEYKNGSAVYNDNQAMNTVVNPYSLVKSQQKIAILIDGETSGSAEALALAFKGRPNTKIFGEHTCGLSIRSTNFQLPDGGTLILATDFIADRNRNNTNGGSVTPDIEADSFTKAVDVAAEWLRQP